jgi:hypothetical protein
VYLRIIPRTHWWLQRREEKPEDTNEMFHNLLRDVVSPAPGILLTQFAK